MKQKTLLAALLLAGTAAFTGCSTENDDNPTPTPRRWVKVYNSVTLGDDENTPQGQFLVTKTGATVKLADTAAERSQLTLLYNVTYGGTNYLSAPANMDEEDPYDTYEGPIYNAPGAGIDNWSAADKNSLEIREPGMAIADFNAMIADGSWTAFDNLFKNSNDGDADLSDFGSIYGPEVGDIYLMQVNGSMRMMGQVLAKNNEQDGAGFITLKLVVEGREDMGSGGVDLMPAE